jgi:hypothetical protein
LPAALPLFATGLGALGLLGWRRKCGRTLLLLQPDRNSWWPRDHCESVFLFALARILRRDQLRVGDAPKRDNEVTVMKANQSERLRRSKEFEVNLSRLRANQIETMIAEFDRMSIDLGRQIEAEEMRAGIDEPTHFAYPTYAKSARERRVKLQRSADALRIKLNALRLEANESPNWQFASATTVAA